MRFRRLLRLIGDGVGVIRSSLVPISRNIGYMLVNIKVENRMINLCSEIGCKHWSDGTRHQPSGSLGGYGCQRFASPSHCPVAFIKHTKWDEYRIYREDDCPKMVVICAKACCPVSIEKLINLHNSSLIPDMEEV
jgi:hypothetical protein